jgi:hypothetical protein
LTDVVGVVGEERVQALVFHRQFEGGSTRFPTLSTSLGHARGEVRRPRGSRQQHGCLTANRPLPNLQALITRTFRISVERLSRARTAHD